MPPYVSRSGTVCRNSRVLLGKHFEKYPARSFVDFLKAQVEHAPLFLEAGWLVVGHIDEMVQFLPRNNALGFRIAIPDTTSALKLFRKLNDTGHGGTSILIFKGDMAARH
ncbi:Protein-arginine deiminase [Metarhizium guizhouense ARSEF 977]|uniref:Protein-arginine deiminase n=1 Tax=Metarhizium guizhouense (strain ARSEF 977) TaxID=1276136 RepID=A0A0B4HXI8_METGA|nr:Protein-arginine deiminase [Metarhizium guizhouense ARSEF 977]